MESLSSQIYFTPRLSRNCIFWWAACYWPTRPNSPGELFEVIQMHSNQQQPHRSELPSHAARDLCRITPLQTFGIQQHYCTNLLTVFFFNVCFCFYLDSSVILLTLRPTKHLINRKKYDHVGYRGTSTHFLSGCTPGSNLAADVCWLTLESKHHTQGSFTEKRRQSMLINWLTALPCGQPRLLQFLTVTETETGQELVASFIQLDICPSSLP